MDPGGYDTGGLPVGGDDGGGDIGEPGEPGELGDPGDPEGELGYGDGGDGGLDEPAGDGGDGNTGIPDITGCDSCIPEGTEVPGMLGTTDLNLLICNPLGLLAGELPALLGPTTDDNPRDTTDGLRPNTENPCDKAEGNALATD